MEDRLLAALSKLRRCRDRLAGPVGFSTGAIRGEEIRSHLDRAWRAAEVISSAAAAAAAAAAAGSSEASSASHLPAACDSELIVQGAEEAASSLAFIADVLQLAAGSPQAGAQADATNVATASATAAAVASEARSLVTHIARSLARLQQRRVFQSADVARAALAAGDPAAAASAALRAEEAAAITMWVACVGGLEVVREVRPAQRAAAEAVAAAEDGRAHRKRVRALETDSDTGAVAVPTSTGGSASSPSLRSSTAVAVAESSEAAAASPADVIPTVTRTATMMALTAESVAVETRATEPAAATSAAAAVLTAGKSRAVAVAAAPNAAEAAALSSREARAAAPAAAEAVATATKATGPLPGPATTMAAEHGEALVITAATAEGMTAPASGGMAVAAAGRPMAAVGFGAGVATTVATAVVVTAADDGVSLTVAQPTAAEVMPPERAMPAVAAPSAAVTTAVEGSTPCTVAGTLSYLAGLADQATPEGRVSGAALTEAGRRCAAMGGPPSCEWVAAAAAAWTDPETRCRLAKLLSYTVRQLLVVDPAAEDLDLESYDVQQLAQVVKSVGASDVMPWSSVFVPILMSIHFVLSEPTAGPLQAAVLEILRLLVRTDLVQCLARLLAAMSSPIISASAEPAAVMKRIMRRGAWFGIGRALMELASTFSVAALFSDQPKAQAAMRQLRGALLRSRAVEHLIRAGVPLIQHAATDAAAPDGGSDPAAQQRTGPQERNEFRTMMGMMCGMVQDLLVATLAREDRPLAVWANAVLAGPCVQYFLLLHAVSQLCAADGETDYGLPADARLPAVEAEDDGEQATTDPGSAGPTEGCTSTGPLRLQAGLMAGAFGWWARNTRTRPCSDRALRAVCERAAAAGAGGSSSAGGRFSPPGDAVAMSVVALHCAVACTPNGAGGDYRGLWRPVVQTANAAVNVRPSVELLDGVTPLRLLLALPLPPLGSSLAGPESQSLPPLPGPDLAAALAAGYVPALERTIRNEARLAGASPQQLAPVLQGIRSLLGGSPRGLAGLMAYGDPTQVASLLATLGKVMDVARSAAAGDQLHELLTEVWSATKYVRDWDGRWSVPADRFWWRRHGGLVVEGAQPDAGAGSGDAGGICGGGASSSSGGGGGGRGGGSGEGGGGGGGCSLPPLLPLHQLSLLGAFAANRWMPVLGATAEHLNVTGLVVLSALPPLVHAYLHCSSRSRGLGGRESSGGDRSAALAAAAAGSARDGSNLHAAEAGSSNAARDAAGSWERFLLREVDLPGLIEDVAQAVQDVQIIQDMLDLSTFHFTVFLHGIAAAVLHLMVAFPSQGRAVLRAPIRSADGRKVALLDWLRGELEAVRDDSLSDDAISHFLELAPAVAAGREPGPEDLARLQRDEGEFGWAARLGTLLPPPCFVAAALGGLPLCANPLCTNLEGDSEAGLMQAGRKGGGGASYCRRACQLAQSQAVGGRKAG